MSVIAPSRGRSSKVSTLLHGLAGQRLPDGVDLEVIIVIDGDEPENSAALDTPEASDRVSFEVLTQPFGGAAAARNRGINAAKGDAFLFLNDDVVASDDLVAAHVRRLDGGARAVLGAAPWRAPAESTIFDAFVARTPAVFRPLTGDATGAALDFRHAWTLNLSVRRDAIVQAPAFQPDLRPVYYEDLEFAYRQFGPAPMITYAPEASVEHDHEMTAEAYFLREALLGVMSTVLFEANRECHDAIMPGPPREHAEAVRGGLAWDVRDHARLLRGFLAAGAAPAAGEVASDVASLYVQHLPLKRRAFRLGLIAAVDAPETPWTDRAALGSAALRRDSVFAELFSD